MTRGVTGKQTDDLSLLYDLRSFHEIFNKSEVEKFFSLGKTFANNFSPRALISAPLSFRSRAERLRFHSSA